MLVLIGVVLWMARNGRSGQESMEATATNGLWRVVFLGLTLLALYLFVRRPQWRGWSILPVLAVVGWMS
jgi:hypothetical protein